MGRVAQQFWGGLPAMGWGERGQRRCEKGERRSAATQKRGEGKLPIRSRTEEVRYTGFGGFQQNERNKEGYFGAGKKHAVTVDSLAVWSPFLKASERVLVVVWPNFRRVSGEEKGSPCTIDGWFLAISRRKN
ncbi:hypothetical protein FXO38_15576 [Capsicum annuum]|nr:hypothetical protein FXO37_28185 [Capsicum annuum]KAF3653610.1 hypothetical protein FXO38_15576 [Capsicum annuum]